MFRLHIINSGSTTGTRTNLQHHLHHCRQPGYAGNSRCERELLDGQGFANAYIPGRLLRQGVVRQYGFREGHFGTLDDYSDIPDGCSDVAGEVAADMVLHEKVEGTALADGCNSLGTGPVIADHLAVVLVAYA
jgi:hypothetical protein